MEDADREAWRQLNRDITECRACPRLVLWREETARVKRRAYQGWTYWGRPVPGFGDRNARLLILGLAPGAHGSNRTGRMFTGDSSGTTLYAALHRAGFANQPDATDIDDGLALRDAFITAVVRCAPPKNRPTSQELQNCRPFLIRELELLKSVNVVLALGRVAFDGFRAILKSLGYSMPKLAFGHGVCYNVPGPWPTLMASYHPSRQNTQTGRLTEAMLDEVLLRASWEVERVTASTVC